MKRKILFKAKRLDNGEWVFGVPTPYTYKMSDGKTVGFGMFCTRDISDSKGVFNPCVIDVHPETVCQYTGRKDKNGARIFEWDRVIDRDGPYQEFEDSDVIIWDDTGGWGLGTCEWLTNSKTEQSFEVIGNIHDET